MKKNYPVRQTLEIQNTRTSAPLVKVNIYEAKSVTASTLLYRLALLMVALLS